MNILTKKNVHKKIRLEFFIHFFYENCAETPNIGGNEIWAPDFENSKYPSFPQKWSVELEIEFLSIKHLVLHIVAILCQTVLHIAAVLHIASVLHIEL